ncbi:PH domain-containing protein [Anaerolineales bacterium HSG25]|nr:PH domain-containing protein [Anaerolineales bacterium HSG25]
MIFQPYPTQSGYIALGTAVASGLAAIVLLTQLPMQADLAEIFTLFMAALIILIAMLLAMSWALLMFGLKYQLNRNGIIVHWGYARQSIPFGSIEEIIPGRGLPKPQDFRGLSIGSLRIGRGELVGYGPTYFYTTSALANSLLIVTPQQAYFVSPADTDAFLKAWKSRQEIGPTQEWPAKIERNWPFNIPILADWLTWGLLLASLITCLTLFGYLAFAFTDLPRDIALQFDTAGQVSRAIDKAFLFVFPVVGFTMLILNTVIGGLVYKNERLAAYFIWSSALLVQICLWVAVYSLLS